MGAVQAAADADPGSAAGYIITQVVIIIILILVNAFYASAEMAMVSLDQTKLEEDAKAGNAKAKRLLSLTSDFTSFLSTVQVCITLAGFFMSALAATGIAQELGKWFVSKGLSGGRELATVIITVLISFFTIVFGELIPKRTALQDPEAFAYRAANRLWWSSIIFKPLVSLLSLVSNQVLRMRGIDPAKQEDRVTMADIEAILQRGQNQGVIDQSEEKVISSLFDFEEITAEEIMTPRTDVEFLRADASGEELEENLLNSSFSRMPVYEDKIDNIIGVLHIKDYTRAAYYEGFENIKIKDIMREPYFVPERKNVNELFNEMRDDNTHMAFLIDEYGGFSGLVTMEDLIEEVIGDISDEFDQDEPEIEQFNRHNYWAKGSLSIKDLNDAIGTELDEDAEDYDTLAGLLFYLMGRVPRDSERPFIEYQGIQFWIEKMDHKKISRVRISYVPEEEEGGEE